MAQEDLFSKELADELGADQPPGLRPEPPGARCRVCGDLSRAAGPCYIRVASQTTSGPTLTVRWVTFATTMCSQCYRRGAYLGLMPWLRWTTFLFLAPMASVLALVALKEMRPPDWLRLSGALVVAAMPLGFYASRCRRYAIQRRRLPEVLGRLDSKLRHRLGIDSWDAQYVVTVIARPGRSETVTEL